jgi:hypothetical protein
VATDQAAWLVFGGFAVLAILGAISKQHSGAIFTGVLVLAALALGFGLLFHFFGAIAALLALIAGLLALILGVLLVMAW